MIWTSGFTRCGLAGTLALVSLAIRELGIGLAMAAAVGIRDWLRGFGFLGLGFLLFFGLLAHDVLSRLSLLGEGFGEGMVRAKGFEVF